MDLWWDSLDLYLKIMWGIAIPFSIIFIIQTVMTFLGMGETGEISGDAHADSDMSMPFQFFTFRNLVNFFLGFSWAGITFFYAVESKVWLTFISVFIGLLLVAIVMSLLYALSRTTQSGNIDINNAIGRSATVYFPIPAFGKGMGKIQLSIQQAVREYDAVSETENDIPTGSIVQVKKIINEHTLLVE